VRENGKQPANEEEPGCSEQSPHVYPSGTAHWRGATSPTNGQELPLGSRSAAVDRCPAFWFAKINESPAAPSCESSLSRGLVCLLSRLPGFLYVTIGRDGWHSKGGSAPAQSLDPCRQPTKCDPPNFLMARLEASRQALAEVQYLPMRVTIAIMEASARRNHEVKCSPNRS